jgi:hypothetical protein
VDALHQRYVDHGTDFDRRSARHIVSPATNGDFQSEITTDIDRIEDIGNPRHRAMSVGLLSTIPLCTRLASS